MYMFDDHITRNYDHNRGDQFYEELSESTLAYRDFVIMSAATLSLIIGYRVLTHILAGLTDSCRSVIIYIVISNY